MHYTFLLREQLISNKLTPQLVFKLVLSRQKSCTRESRREVEEEHGSRTAETKINSRLGWKQPRRKEAARKERLRGGKKKEEREETTRREKRGENERKENPRHKELE